MAKKKSNINKYINNLGINEVYSKISRGSSFIPGVIDDAKLSGRVVKKDQSYKAKPFNKSLNNIRPILEAGFSSRGNFRTNYTIPLTQTYLLDTYSGAAAAYSVRKLSSSYSGSALRVRRSSDNAEQDIGFSGNDLDTSALTTFVGANDGFVVTWYDQSGNGLDATNGTASSQPQIISSGSLILSNSTVSIDFQADDFLGITDISPITTFIVGKMDLIGALNYVLFKPSITRGYFFGGTMSRANGLGVYDGSIKSIAGEDLNQTLGYFNYASTRFQVAKNGAAASDLAAGSNFQINELGRSTGGASFDGKLQEFILYTSDNSANKSDIESNINTYYSIY